MHSPGSQYFPPLHKGSFQNDAPILINIIVCDVSGHNNVPTGNILKDC
jgi:hypothetical protein